MSNFEIKDFKINPEYINPKTWNNWVIVGGKRIPIVNIKIELPLEEKKIKDCTVLELFEAIRGKI